MLFVTLAVLQKTHKMKRACCIFYKSTRMNNSEQH